MMRPSDEISREPYLTKYIASGTSPAVVIWMPTVLKIDLSVFEYNHYEHVHKDQIHRCNMHGQRMPAQVLMARAHGHMDFKYIQPR